MGSWHAAKDGIYPNSFGSRHPWKELGQCTERQWSHRQLGSKAAVERSLLFLQPGHHADVGTGYDQKHVGAGLEKVIPGVLKFRRQRGGRFDGVGELVHDDQDAPTTEFFLDGLGQELKDAGPIGRRHHSRRKRGIQETGARLVQRTLEYRLALFAGHPIQRRQPTTGGKLEQERRLPQPAPAEQDEKMRPVLASRPSAASSSCRSTNRVTDLLAIAKML